MGLLFSLLYSAGGMVITFGIWYALSVILVLLLSPVYANLGYIYGPEDSVGDSTTLLLLLLLWDRFFGPYGRALRKVCKYIPGRETVIEGYEYDR
jgi:hypothetical protein